MKNLIINLLSAVLLVVIFTACQSTSPPAEVTPEEDIQPQIVGGTVSTPGEFPWMAQLKFLGSHACGGALIDKSWVLTAAHCALGTLPSNWTVVLGEHDRSINEGTEQSIAVSNIHIHPSYVNTTFANDIALFRLATPATLNSHVSIIDLAALPPVGTHLTVSGWGKTIEGGSSSNILRKVQVPIVSSSQCNTAYPGRITTSMFCTGYPAGGKDSCQGDSGGPIFRSRQLVGLVSWGTGCARANKYGVYTNISQFTDWISTFVRSSKALAWVWANRHLSTFNVAYTPAINYQYNAHFNPYPTANNTVTRTGVGRYLVKFPNLNVIGGTAHVSAYRGKHHCKVLNWGSGKDVSVNVICFNANGRRVNGKFTVFFHKDSALRTRGNAYLWANNPTRSSYTPNPVYQYNSRGDTNTVSRLGVGRYRVHLPNMERNTIEANKGGTILVTAYGSGSERCKVGGWSQSGNTVLANVNCFAANGNRVDTRFTLSFMREPGTLLANFSEDKQEAFYVWANGATTPNIFYQSNSYGNPTSVSNPSRATVSNIGTGVYRVSLPGVKAFNKTTAQAVAYGSDSSYCNISRWTANSSINGTDVFVNCYNNAGNRTNTRFNLLYYTNSTILF